MFPFIAGEFDRVLSLEELVKPPPTADADGVNLARCTGDSVAGEPVSFPGAALASPSPAPASVAVLLAALANRPNGCFTASSKYPGWRYDPIRGLASAGRTEPP